MPTESAMKKVTAILIICFISSLSFFSNAEAGGRYQRGYKYERQYNYNNGNDWAAAAIGAVVGVAIGAAIANSANSANNNMQTQPYVFVNQTPQYIPNPVYQAQPINVLSVCQQTLIPVYDAQGILLMYRQACVK